GGGARGNGAVLGHHVAGNVAGRDCGICNSAMGKAGCLALGDSSAKLVRSRNAGWATGLKGETPYENGAQISCCGNCVEFPKSRRCSRGSGAEAGSVYEIAVDGGPLGRSIQGSEVHAGHRADCRWFGNSGEIAPDDRRKTGGDDHRVLPGWRPGAADALLHGGESADDARDVCTGDEDSDVRFCRGDESKESGRRTYASCRLCFSGRQSHQADLDFPEESEGYIFGGNGLREEVSRLFAGEQRWVMPTAGCL